MDYGQNDELLQRARLLKDDRKFNSNERKKLGNLSIFKENKNGMNPNTVASVVQGSSLVSIHGRPLKVMRGAALLINDVVYYVKSITEGHLEIDRDYEGCTDSEAKVSMNPKEVDHSVLLEPMLPSPEQISQAVEGLDRIAEMFHGWPRKDKKKRSAKSNQDAKVQKIKPKNEITRNESFEKPSSVKSKFCASQSKVDLEAYRASIADRLEAEKRAQRLAREEKLKLEMEEQEWLKEAHDLRVRRFQAITLRRVQKLEEEKQALLEAERIKREAEIRLKVEREANAETLKEKCRALQAATTRRLREREEELMMRERMAEEEIKLRVEAIAASRKQLIPDNKTIASQSKSNPNSTQLSPISKRSHSSQSSPAILSSSKSVKKKYHVKPIDTTPAKYDGSDEKDNTIIETTPKILLDMHDAVKPNVNSSSMGIGNREISLTANPWHGEGELGEKDESSDDDFSVDSIRVDNANNTKTQDKCDFVADMSVISDISDFSPKNTQCKPKAVSTSSVNDKVRSSNDSFQPRLIKSKKVWKKLKPIPLAPYQQMKSPPPF